MVAELRPVRRGQPSWDRLNADRPDHLLGELASLVEPVPIKRLIVHRPFEVDVHIALPGESNPAVQLDGPV